MSPRHRLGVALLLDPPGSLEVDGLRRALGDSSLEAVVPHLTLVPPVNVRSGDLDQALAVVRRAAAVEDGPLHLDLGPVATFLPASPVVYLAVGGVDLDRLARLRSAVVSGPFLRPDRWPWVPHVTVADQALAEEAGAALAALRRYRSRTSFDRVVVLEERHRRWHPLADAALGPPAVVGRGGLELEITEGRMPGPDVMAMAESQLADIQLVGIDDAEVRSNLAELVGAMVSGQPTQSVVLTGRREGGVAGAAVAWQSGRTGGPINVTVLVDQACRHQGVGRALLAALEISLRRRDWAVEAVRGYGPAGFYRQSSGWVRLVEPACEVMGLSSSGQGGAAARP
jgi:2'-5' RNA ligase/GNAT superfamily N-acetyltransferase